MARAAAQRAWARAHEHDGKPMWHDGTFRNWATAYSPATPYHRDDGVTVLVGDRDDGSWDRLLEHADPDEPPHDD